MNADELYDAIQDHIYNNIDADPKVSKTKYKIKFTMTPPKNTKDEENE